METGKEEKTVGVDVSMVPNTEKTKFRRRSNGLPYVCLCIHVYIYVVVFGERFLKKILWYTFLSTLYRNYSYVYLPYFSS